MPVTEVHSKPCTLLIKGAVEAVPRVPGVLLPKRNAGTSTDTQRGQLWQETIGTKTPKAPLFSETTTTLSEHAKLCA